MPLFAFALRSLALLCGLPKASPVPPEQASHAPVCELFVPLLVVLSSGEATLQQQHRGFRLTPPASLGYAVARPLSDALHRVGSGGSRWRWFSPLQGTESASFTATSVSAVLNLEELQGCWVGMVQHFCCTARPSSLVDSPSARPSVRSPLTSPFLLTTTALRPQPTSCRYGILTNYLALHWVGT